MKSNIHHNNCLINKESCVPCKHAFTEKKTTVIVGPYSACPMNIFFSVETRSRFGKSFDMKLNQKCRDGPKISIPYPAMRNVLTKSKGSEDGSAIVYRKVHRGTHIRMLEVK
jgi:hypothetical protein